MGNPTHTGLKVRSLDFVFTDNLFPHYAARCFSSLLLLQKIYSPRAAASLFTKSIIQCSLFKPNTITQLCRGQQSKPIMTSRTVSGTGSRCRYHHQAAGAVHLRHTASLWRPSLSGLDHILLAGRHNLNQHVHTPMLCPAHLYVCMFRRV